MSPKKLLVLGATGGTGKHVVAQALEQGHTVTALVRDPGKLTLTHDRLHVVHTTDIADLAVLAEAVRGQDVVISALGVGALLKPDGLITRSMHALVPVMEREGVRRLVFTSAFGVGDTYADAPIIARLFFRLLLRKLYADKAASEVELRRSGLDWTLVYPTKFTDGPKTGRYRSGEQLTMSSLPSVSRADVAQFLLTQVDDRAYVRKVVLVSD